MDCQSAYYDFKTSSDHAVRVKALNFITWEQCKSKAHLLFENFANEPEDIQLSIVFGMRMLAGHKAKKALEALMNAPALSVPVRAALAEMAGFLELEQSKPVLIQQLGHSAPEVRFWSCEALGFLGDRNDLPNLQRLLTDHEIGFEGMTVASMARFAIEVIESKE